MAETQADGAPAPMAPSDILMALYMNDRDTAETLAAGATLTLPELAAFGNVGRLTTHLAEHPEDVHVHSPDGWTALHLAAYFGYAAVAVRLLRSDASITARSTNPQGNTPLHAAIAGRRELPVITALLAAGSDAGAVDAQGYTPLHLAASRGDVAVAELLMACGADPGVRTGDGRLASDLAREHDHDDLSALLHGP